MKWAMLKHDLFSSNASQQMQDCFAFWFYDCYICMKIIVSGPRLRSSFLIVNRILYLYCIKAGTVITKNPHPWTLFWLYTVHYNILWWISQCITENPVSCQFILPKIFHQSWNIRHFTNSTQSLYSYRKSPSLLLDVTVKLNILYSN